MTATRKAWWVLIVVLLVAVFIVSYDKAKQKPHYEKPVGAALLAYEPSQYGFSVYGCHLSWYYLLPNAGCKFIFQRGAVQDMQAEINRNPGQAGAIITLIASTCSKMPAPAIPFCIAIVGLAGWRVLDKLREADGAHACLGFTISLLGGVKGALTSLGTRVGTMHWATTDRIIVHLPDGSIDYQALSWKWNRCNNGHTKPNKNYLWHCGSYPVGFPPGYGWTPTCGGVNIV